MWSARPPRLRPGCEYTARQSPHPRRVLIGAQTAWSRPASPLWRSLRPLPRAPNEKYHVHVRHPCALSEPRSYLAGRPESRQMFSDGKAYERLMGRWSQPVGEAFLDWLDVPKGMRCLDV